MVWITVRPLYSLLISPAWARRLVCSEIVLKLQPKLSVISSTVMPAFWATKDKISIRRWLATPLKCRSICFAVFGLFAIFASYHNIPTFSRMLECCGWDKGARHVFYFSVICQAPCQSADGGSFKNFRHLSIKSMENILFRSI